MTERLLKHQRDVVPTGLLDWFIREGRNFMAFLNLSDNERVILIILDDQWCSLAEIERREKSLDLTQEEILGIVNKLIRHGLAESRHHTKHVLVSSGGSGSIISTEYRSTA
jgi:predicted transcriptional regulator